jgi:cysteinyl-tRNA synthetase
VHDIIKKHDPQLIRFFMLSVHYRHPINYNDELLESTKNGLERLRTSYTNLKHRLESSVNLTTDMDDIQWLEQAEFFKDEFIKVMDDDFNTANAISVLFDMAKQANLYVSEKNTSEKVLQAFITRFEELFGVLGVALTEEELLEDEIEALIQKRIDARKNRDFNLADQIREDLKDKNIILEDTAQGTRWKRG